MEREQNGSREVGSGESYRLDSHTLRMNGAKIGVFKERNEIVFCRLLQGANGGALKPKITFEVGGDLAHLQPLLEFRCHDLKKLAARKGGSGKGGGGLTSL